MTTDAYAARPWLAVYTETRAEIVPQHKSALAIFAAAVARAPDAPAVCYFDAVLSYADLDGMSDALASALIARGFRASDRLAIYLQNVPDFVIALVACWKAGGIAVPINPMNREREVRLLLADATPSALICHDGLYRDVVARLDSGASVPVNVILASPRDWQSRNDPRVLRDVGAM